ncbi:type I polyketide synthase [Moorena sp. SIO2C4]|uniref:type I polyketide synthase n=1 Tax=Moorena sp. SIO2C4 TaxID=2607824 RepID=UPI0013C712EE|nr:type I polyketide synthase [Moorena sp. SIO2C4]NES40467.1 type I polyketide synthase [Moorena sp. SIO2C4]
MELSSQTTQLSNQQLLLLKIQQATAKLHEIETAATEPIAVIGIGCRFPGGVDSPETYWKLLQEARDLRTEIPKDRWDVDLYYDSDPDVPNKIYVRQGYFLQQPVDQFEPEFFGISGTEAANMDASQRLLLEVTWEALENAGISPKSLKNTDTGVYVGQMTNDYAVIGTNRPDKLPDFYLGIGSNMGMSAGRIAYILGLQGPTLFLDTSCSSSLVALHLACQSLRSRESNLSLVGGVNLMLAPNTTHVLCKGKALSPDSRCKTFDASADGFARGEGCGIVVLKRLRDALADSDRILALVKGSAINHDGPSSGFTVPNQQAQKKVIHQALNNAKVNPLQISYVECHGTGTSLGDPLEVRALDEVYCQQRTKEQLLFLGAVKSNIGHLEAAAGIAALIKVVLALQHQEIPANLHFNQPNPRINWEQIPVKVPTKAFPWLKGEKPRLAGISGFGMSGTNAHVILEEAPIPVKSKSSRATGGQKQVLKDSKGAKLKREEYLERSLHLLTLSAKTQTALDELVSSYENYLKAHPELGVADICYTANTGRTHFNHKLAVVASNQQELVDKLRQQQEGEEVVGIYSGDLPNNSTVPEIALLFTGQGSQYVNMGRQLYQQAPTFREAINQCEEILSSLETFPNKLLQEILYPADDLSDSSLLDQTAYTQPALFAIEYALFKLWQSWGIKPDVVMGHSVGEYVAATVAGVFSLEAGLKLIAARGSLMQKLPAGGAMVSVMASKSKVLETLKAMSRSEKVAIAAINGPQSIVISGEAEAVEAIATHLESVGIKTKQLQVSHAFHSPLMEPMLAEFEDIANQLTYNQPRIPLISNVTGTKTDNSIATGKYWVNHVRQPVQFVQSMKTLHQEGYELFLEIGPKPILLGMGRQCLPEEMGVWLPSLRPGVDEWQQMLSSLGQLYVQGAKVDWFKFDQNYNREKVILPTYPFQRERYWVETQNGYQPKPYGSTAKNLHPLLGEKLNLAGIENQHRFQSYLTAESPAYLSQHQVFNKVLFPATSYLEIAAAVGKNLLTTGEQVVVSDVTIVRGLVIPETDIKTVQTVISTLENNSYKLEIFSTSEGDNQQANQWTLHAEGKIFLDSTTNAKAKIDLEQYQRECSQVIDIQQHYQQFKSRGIDYGNSFQGIKQLWKGQGKALGKIALPEEIAGQATDYQLHPALLDAALQILGHAIGNTETDDKAYLPVGIDKLKLYRQTITQVWAIVEIPENTLKGSIKLVDNQGSLLAEIEGLRVTATTADALLRSLQPDISHWFYQINWQTQPLPSTTPSSATDKWLVFAQDTQLIEALQHQGHESIRVSPGDTYEKLAQQHYQINPTSREQFQQLLAENPGITQIVYLWGVQEIESKDNLEIQTVQEQSCATVLHLVQAIINSKPETIPKLWLVTRGTQRVISDSEVINPEYGSLWGLGRVIAQEHPELGCKRLDCDPNLEQTQILDSLVAELLSEDVEDQIAIRQGSRYVARLVQKPQQKPITSADQPVQLKLSEYGVIDNLNWQPMQRKTPLANEVEIEVAAVGLNFRDVLNALGLLKDYYAEHFNITSAEQLTFGFECAGKISAVGEQVSQWQVGDEVIGLLLHDGLSSFITTSVEYVVAKPKQMSFSEAATLPLTFLTAQYGLQHLAKIQPGERVLIHAAAGGVGQAAVQIAQVAGAEIFATASPSKWEFLQSLGIKHIMNSRTLDFAEEIMKRTAGEGVDVVLNSLNGEYIPQSLAVLTPKGRFVEIGKIGIWEKEQVKEKRPDVSYFPFDLQEAVQQQPGLIGQLSEELTQQWNQGKLKALPHKVFPSTEITAAFRYMQQAKHVGKVVVSMPEAQSEPKSITADASYLITGGLGALGLEVAQWMVTQGARNIVLTGRRAPKETAQKIIEELETAGASVSVLLGDVSQREDLAKIFQQIQASLPPLKGVIHSAGVLDDALVQNMSWSQFTKVMAPKVQGTWYLHQLTKDFPLDFFVCFSSIASMLGSPGQSNYAAGNGFMDALAHYRRSMGLPGLSINWGAWASAGMAASLAVQNQQRMESMGLSAIEPERGMQALGSLLSESQSQVGVFPVNWSQFIRQFPGGQKIPFLSDFISQTPSLTQKSAFREELEAALVSDRHELLTTHLRLAIAKTLGWKDTQKIGMRQPLFDLGLDSLTAVELKNRLESSLGTSLSSTLLFDYPTVEALVEYLANDVMPIDFSSHLDQTEKALDEEDVVADGSSQLSDITELSEIELEASVLQEIEALEKLI